MVEQLKAFNAPESVIAKYTQSTEPETVYIWEESAPMWDLFLRCHTCWDYLSIPTPAGAMMRPKGLNYSECRNVARPLKLDLDAMETFDLLQAMENAALEEWRSE